MSTTIREAERVVGFLKTAKEIEGNVWDQSLQREFQIRLVKNRQYLNTSANTQSYQKLTSEQCHILREKDIEMTYEMAKSIIDAKGYVGGPEMRGRQSMSVLVKLGLVYYEITANGKIVRISDAGNKLISGEISFEELMCDALFKYQYPNPSEAGFTKWNTIPFINTLRLINEVNILCKERNQNPKGISATEFGIFALSLRRYDQVHATALELLKFRGELKKIPEEDKEEYIDCYIKNYLREFNNPIKNCREYTDNMIRYVRMTRYVCIHGKYEHMYVDLEPRRMTEINSILAADKGEAINFTPEEWNKYMGTYGAYKLPFETIGKLTEIAHEVIYENEMLAKETGEPYIAPALPTSIADFKALIKRERECRTKLQNLLIRQDVHKNYKKIDETIEALRDVLCHNKTKRLAKRMSIELEKWTNVALNILNDAILIRPNAAVGDDNEPLYTAPSGVPDIECYYKSFSLICEVTTLTSRDQWYNEGQPVMRHLREFENKNLQKPNYCLFVAPNLHKDTVNTFYIAVKYEYEGNKQNIIPITITQLTKILQMVKSRITCGKEFLHNQLQELLDVCVDTASVKASTEWLTHIQESIDSWCVKQ